MRSLFLMRCMEECRVKYLFLGLCFLSVTLLANESEVIPNIEDIEIIENNVTQATKEFEPVVVKDNSGLSDAEVREIVQKKDEQEKQKVSIKEVFEVTDQAGEVDLSKIQKSWEELSPTPKKCDWIQTKSLEWFKGEIKAMFDESLEFDSDEIGLYSFDFADIKQIKSFHIISTNIEGLASFSGILRLEDNNLTIINGENSYNFTKDQIVSFAKAGAMERDYWSGKISASIDIRSGNKNQSDYTVQGTLNRRTNSSKLRLDYLGRISHVEDIEIANDHRANGKYDVYLTRDFFWTPFFGEYYRNEYQNIEYQYTFGLGIGYTLIDRKKLEWDISAGPALLRTNYKEVEDGEEASASSISMQLSTIIDYKLSSKIDLKYNYQLTLTDKNSGLYKHHMLFTMENEVTKWLDIDLTAIWDYTKEPEKDASGVQPLKDDYQLLVGFGVDF